MNCLNLNRQFGRKTEKLWQHNEKSCTLCCIWFGSRSFITCYISLFFIRCALSPNCIHLHVCLLNFFCFHALFQRMNRHFYALQKGAESLFVSILHMSASVYFWTQTSNSKQLLCQFIQKKKKLEHINTFYSFFTISIKLLHKSFCPLFCFSLYVCL